MVLRATLVVLCIVLGLALFSSGEEYGWILAATVGVVVAGVALGIEYTLRRAKPGGVVGGAAGPACGPPLAGRGPRGPGDNEPSRCSLPVPRVPLLADRLYSAPVF